MIRWSRPVIDRDQIPLFAPTLDAFLDENHCVRIVAEILAEMDFSDWERQYDGLIGQPPIHPRVLAAAILYGLSLGIRSSRRLEDACANRLDFIWLVEGRRIDHSTFCKFRTQHHPQLKALFGDLVLMGRQMGMARLNQIIWDGTRIKANNSHEQTARQDKLEILIKELEQQFEKMVQEAQAADERENGLYGPEESSSQPLPPGLARKQRRLRAMQRARDVLKTMRPRIKSDVPVPPATAVAFTDPDARILPNKEGGFAPNYTPVVAVDGESGLVLDTQVLTGRCEDEALLPSLQRIEQTLGQLPRQALADSAYHTGHNLTQLEQKQVQALIPQRICFEQNPAQRPDPSQPMPPEQWDQLPRNPSSKGLDKAAFVYDQARDCYHCPMGHVLELVRRREYQQGKQRRQYRIYECSACADCPLRCRCLSGQVKMRQVYRGQYEAVYQRVAERLNSEAGKQAYHRRWCVERLFGVVKSILGVRQFLLRGYKKVNMEWQWILAAYNLRLLLTRRKDLLVQS